MNKNSKIWATTDTGMKNHAFPVNGGPALCRKNIKAREYAVSNNDFASLGHIRGMFTASDVCTSCEAKVRTHEAFLDSEHAIALAMNEEFDAKAAPACTCPRMEPPAKFGHHVVCPLRAADNDSEENDNVSIKEGPLTERQIRILNHLRAGKRHEEIAPMLAPVPGHSSIPQAVTVSVVKQECQNIRVKFGTSTVMQAVSLWATAQAYRETATLLGSHRPPRPDNETDVHVDHVLYGLIQILRERADRLTPR